MPELRSPLPCLTCQADAAFDVKIALGQGMFDRGANLSPAGTPIMCCKIRIMGANMPPSASSVAPATGRFSGGGRRSAGSWPWQRPPPLSR
jgi:hypothetical protein